MLHGLFSFPSPNVCSFLQCWILMNQVLFVLGTLLLLLDQSPWTPLMSPGREALKNPPRSAPVNRHRREPHKPPTQRLSPRWVMLVLRLLGHLPVSTSQPLMHIGWRQAHPRAQAHGSLWRRGCSWSQATCRASGFVNPEAGGDASGNPGSC